MKIQGIKHADRGVGVRDHQLILPSVVCSTHVSRRIATEVGAITFAHQNGCGIIGIDVSGIDNFFIDLANHPNVNSVVVTALGCETIQGNELNDKIAQDSTHYLVIQESGGVEGTVASGVAHARELSAKFPGTVADLDLLTVGLDLSRDVANLAEIRALFAKENISLVEATQRSGSAANFSSLMSQKAHVIVSFPDENQPPTGFPLIPVISIAGSGALHQAIISEFDLASSASAAEILDCVIAIANGKKSKSELSNNGEIVAPRSVRSV